MKSKFSGIPSLVLVLVAFSSLISMFAVTRIDSIVHGDLYRYNLRFSYEWAMPYWTMTTLVFVMGWFNIIIAITFQFYTLLHGRKKAEREEVVELQPQEITPEETFEAETREAITPPIEVELETRREGEEAETPVETSFEEEEQRLFEETTPEEYMETTPSEEAEEWREHEVEPWETVEPTSEPEEGFEEQQEPADVHFHEEPLYTDEEERDLEEMLREPVEVDTSESPVLTRETKAKTKKRKKPSTQT